jgi:hypothetical protein
MSTCRHFDVTTSWIVIQSGPRMRLRRVEEEKRKQSHERTTTYLIFCDQKVETDDCPLYTPSYNSLIHWCNLHIFDMDDLGALYN